MITLKEDFMLKALFNAETEGDLDMILANTKSKGIMEAVREIRILNLKKRIRYEYRMWLKAKRDRMAEDAYVRDEGKIEGREEEKAIVVRNMLAQGMELSQICRIAECDRAFVEKVRAVSCSDRND